MEIITYFLTVVPVGISMLGLAAWYDYKFVPTAEKI
jgi:hypothetical protein